MRLAYDRLSTDDRRGTTQADYLVSIEGDLRIVDNDTWVYDEPS